MRTLSILAVLALAQAGAAWAIGDLNTARPGGAFSTVAAESAGSCERLCVEDTLCMAWSFRDNLCELKAVVPAPVAQDGTVSGVAPRAPASLRVHAPLRDFAAIDPLPDIALAEVAGPLASPAAGDDISDQLLGGPESGEGLRLEH